MTIIFGILKLILIILLVLLAAALVIISLILFAPVRYKLKGSFINEIPDAGAELRWLHGVLSAKAAYTREHGLEAYINVFGHKIYDILGDEDEEETIAGTGSAYAGRDENLYPDKNDLTDRQTDIEPEDKHHDISIPTDDIKVNLDDQLQYKERSFQTSLAHNKDKLKADSTYVSPDEHKPKVSVYSTNPLARLQSMSRSCISEKPRALLRKAADRISYMTDAAEAKLKAIFDSLKETAKAAKAAFTKRSSQLKKLKALWDDKRFAACKALLLDRIVKLLSELKPRSGSGYVRVGRDDPYSTGQAMQLAAFLYPFYADTIEVIPDFDQSILEGELDIGGRLRLIIPAEAALRIFFNKELKLMYKRARHILELD